jgi:hypothetical protein
LAYLQSGFPSQAMWGTCRIKQLFCFQRAFEGVVNVPLIISRFFGQKLPP